MATSVAADASPVVRTGASRPLRVALVGCGAVSRANLLPVLAGHDALRLVALVDRSEPRARELATAYLVPQVLTDSDRLDRDICDAVVLATPPAHHAPATIAFAARGLHVFVEKPMATSAADAEAMVAAADRAGVTLAVGLYRRFLPSVRLLKHLIAGAEFGSPLAIDIEEGGNYGWELAALDVLTRAGGGGGVLMDIGTHLIDELLHVVPGDLRIRRFEDNARGGIETDCVAQADLTTTTGSLPVRLELSRTRDLRNSIRIECEQATLELHRADFTQVVVHRASQDVRASSPQVRLSAEWADGGAPFVGYQAFRDEIDDWLRAVAGGSRPVLSGHSVVPVSRAIETCYRVRTPMSEPWVDEGLVAATTDVGRGFSPGHSRQRRVLVTGAGGFLGGRTVEILRERYGWDVVPLVRSPRSAASLARWNGDIALGDVCSADDMARAVKGCDAVVHCAVGTVWPPDAARKVTIDGTRTVAEAARAAGVKRFVHISTLFVHRRDGDGEITEATPLEPPAQDDYGQAKLAAERALEGVARNGLSTIVLRPARIYGPFSRTFTIRPLQAIRERRFAIAGDASVPANMVYVDNVVEAIARALEAPDSFGGSAFLVSDPEQVSLGEFYEFFARESGVTIDVVPPSEAQAPTAVGLWGRWVGAVKSIASSPEFRGIVRRVINTDPIGALPRRLWNRSPAFQASMLRRFGSSPAVVYRPGAGDGIEPLVYDGERGRVSVRTLEQRLGFTPLVRRDRAMTLTIDWARHARLLR